MRPGEPYTAVIGRRTATGLPSTGKVAADFGIVWKKDGVTTAITPTVTEVDTAGTWREYRVSITLPTSGPYLLHGSVSAASGTDVIRGGVIDLEIENADLDSLSASLPIIPVAQLSATSRTADPQILKIIANRYQTVEFNVRDANGAVVDLSATGKNYNNWRFSVWDKTHSASIYTLSSGITGSALGVAAWAIPENASFYSQMAAAIAGGNDQIELYWDLAADLNATVGQTQTVLYGKLLLYRYESPA